MPRSISRSKVSRCLRPVLITALLPLFAGGPILEASHAHLTYPSWWQPAYETPVLVSPAPPTAEGRAKAFAERNSPENIETLAREFFSQIDLDHLLGQPGHTRLDSWGRNERRPDYQGKKTVPATDFGALLKAGDYQGALDAYRDFFFERLRNPPPEFALKAAHPLQRWFIEFIHRPEELLNDNVARFTMLDAEQKGAVVRLNMGPPGRVNWTWYPEQFEPYDHLIFRQDGSFMVRCASHPIFYNALLAGYLQTGDDRYLAKWCAFMDDRAMNLSRDARAAGFSGAPESHSQLTVMLALLGNIMWVAQNQPGSDRSFSSATLARLLTELWSVVPTNMRLARRTSSNRSIEMYSAGYFRAGVSFPEFLSSPYAIREKVRIIESYPTVTAMPDGSSIEYSEGYNGVYITSTVHARSLLLATEKSRRPWISPDWLQELDENLNMVTAYRIHHKGNLGWEWYPNFYSLRYAQDFGGQSPGYLTLTPAALVQPENRKIISTLWGDGGAGAPGFLSEAWPYGGQYLVREGWGRDDQHLFMGSQRPHNSHTWKNANDIQLFAFGQPLLTLHTEGYGFRRSGYAEDPNFSEWEEGFRRELREKYKNPDLRGLHQWEFTPLFVDGLPQIGHEAFDKQSFEFRSRPGPTYGRKNHMAYQTPLKNRWHESDRFNFLEGEYSGAFASVDGKRLIEGVSHQRQVGFLRGLGLWIVFDRVRSAQPHTYKLDWKPAQPFETDRRKVEAQDFFEKTAESKSAGDQKQVPGFTASQVLSSDKGKSVKTANPETANISIYMHSAADLRMYQYGAEFAGAGDQLVVSALYPRRTIRDELVSIKTIPAGTNITGFDAALTGGARVLCRAAANGIDTLEVSGLRMEGEALVLVIMPDGGRYGLALGCRNLALGGKRQQVSRADFEFSVSETAVTAVLPIYKPMDRVEVFPKADRFADKVEVSMTHNETDTEIRYTLDGMDPAVDSPLYTEPFVLRGTTMVKATAFRKELKETPKTQSSTLASVPIRAYYERHAALRPGKAAPTAQGLNYTYHESDWSLGGTMAKVPPPKDRGVVKKLLELPQRSNDSSFLYDYRGYLNIPADGVYTFHAPWEMITPTQDAGFDLRLWIGDEEWYPTTRWHNFGGWSVPLKKGSYPFRVVYIDQRNSDMVKEGDGFMVWQGEKPDIDVSGPGLARQPLPAEWLRRN